MTPEERAQTEFAGWYDALNRGRDGFPPRGTIAGALVVLEALKKKYDLRIEAHTTRGRGQIKGASGAAVKRILGHYGEARPFATEGGRTNRGLIGGITAMLDALHKSGLEDLQVSQRNAILDTHQRFLVDKVQEFHNRQRLRVSYESSQSVRQWVRDLLSVADKTGKRGPVAQHLVGAKLQLRFSDLEVENNSFSAADAPTNRPGDFLIKETVFHITVAPQRKLYDKCLDNLASGLRVYILVPDESVIGVRQNAELIAPGRISVESIESFVAQNIEELAQFSTQILNTKLRDLLVTHNKRVDDAELDKSIMVEIPRNLMVINDP